MLDKANLVFTSTAVIYKGESYPVFYFLEKGANLVLGKIEYLNSIVIMAESAKGLPDDLVKHYNYKCHTIENETHSINYKSNFACVGSNDNIFDAVDLAYKGRRIYERRKREFIIDIAPYNYVE